MFSWLKSYDREGFRVILGVFLVFEGLLFFDAKNPAVRAIGIGSLAVGVVLLLANQVVRNHRWARRRIHGDSKDPVMRSIQVRVAEMSVSESRVEFRIGMSVQTNERLEEMVPPGGTKAELVRRAFALYDCLYDYGVMTGKKRLFIGTDRDNIETEVVVMQQDE